MQASLISLGANLGNVRETMHAAKRLLQDTFGARNLTFSHLYKTPPVGGPAGQQEFLNAVAEVRSDRSVWEIWDSIKQVETSLGRQRLLRWEARRIDIDLLLVGQERIWTPHLKVPHPRMCMRSFVLKPAIEIAPLWVDPVTNWSLSQLNTHLDNSRDDGSVIRVLCENSDQLDLLRGAFHRTHESDRTRVAWEVGRPQQMPLSGTDPISIANTDESKLKSKLTVATVASPDPMTVLWEDFSAPWAQWLNLSAPTGMLPTRCPFTGPRYLMPTNDLQWAVHEIMAANQAMHSWIEKSEPF